ncbi:hypothetical protein Pla144_06130 [Bythopirellula polymerisocia]|uniref:DUF7670 domain-containing protein n=2 Tax=Bythopirellula polymerisocia TaxID=2528003 RepID=A0A5C6D1X0_9BACT|nr:hypothetical protein Pla144_06130 [Bythopirellula polymerisocia]
MQSRVAIWFRWAGRILSLLFLGFFLFMLIAHLVPGAERQFGPLSFHDRLSFTCIALMFMGYLVAWKWQAIGGLIGLAAAAVLGFMTNISLPMFFLIGVPGLAYLFSSLAISTTEDSHTKGAIPKR